MRTKHVRGAAIAALALCLATSVPPARADDGPQAGDGPKRLARYTACASGLAVATTFTQAYMAIVLCVQVVLGEMPAS